MIVFGKDCETSTGPFETKTWIKPGKWTTTEFSETISHHTPSLTICDDSASSHSDLDYKFTSAHLIAGGNLDWITFDRVANKFILAPSRQEYYDYHGQTMTIKFEAFDAASSSRPRHTTSDFGFEIEFNSVILEKCYASIL